MKDKLVVQVSREYKVRLQWEVHLDDDEIDLGGCLGDDATRETPEPPTDREGYETWLAEKLARESGAERDVIGFYWETEAKAKKVLSQIREGWKQDRPLPEWARTALAAGWKPPKGWKA
jgi:hypothetical protein